MVEQNHAVGDVLLNPLTSHLAVAAFGGNHGGDSFGLQPAEQATEFRAENVGIGKPGKERLDRIQNYALGAHRVHRAFQADEEPFQIVLAGFVDFTALDANIIHKQLLASA